MQTGVFFIQKVHFLYNYRLIFIQAMGSESSNQHERFYSRYNFVQAVNDHNFGLVKVYRKKQLNFDYVMVFERMYAPNQLALVKQQLQRVKSRYSLQEQPLFLKILNVEQLPGNNCGGNILRIYLQYLNFTLKDAINARKQAMQPFTSDQIMYVIQNAIAAYTFLKNLNANYLTIRSDTIYINPDGILRFNPIRIEKTQTQNQNCNCMNMPNEVYFEKSQRQFLIQLKKICPQNDQNFKRNYELLAKFNHSRTLQQVKTYLWPTQVDTLLSGKKLETTDLSSGGGRQGIFEQSRVKSKISLRESRYG